MRLVLIRHAEAEGMRTSDAERALTARGQEQARETAVWLKQVLAGETPQLLASPYVRAQQTAAAITQAMQLEPSLLTALTPDTDPRHALRAIEESMVAENVVVVTHMPLVAALASWLESGVLSAGRGFMLAEARVLDIEVLGPSMARLRAHYFPGME
jgi:phosphohistidine phosphatase